MEVEVVYALPTEQKCYRFEVPPGITVQMAIDLSKITQAIPALQTPDLLVGIWGKRVTLERVVRPNDRIEIYRPLLIDPKKVRQLLVKTERKGKKRSFYPPR
ncbi:MAG: RnfH family protein [Legionellales bacterium]|nr:RnfH family protein [Legionellales bacterium]